MFTPDNIKDKVAIIGDELKTIRRYLHANPELSFQEEETSKYISNLLKSWGIKHKTNIGGYGIVGVIEGEKVFSNFYNSLKPGGMLLVSTPSDQGGSDVHHHDHEQHENDGSNSFIDEHVRDGYGIDDINAKLKLAGFSKSEAYYQYGPPGNLSWKLSMKYPIIMLNKSYLFFIVLPFYYLLTFPISLILNYIDVRGNHKTGTGLVAKAWK